MAPPPLPGVLADLAPLLDHWGYLAVAALVFVEDFGVPVPGETVMIAAAVYAGAGRLDIAAVVGVALLAAVAGDNVGYVLGRFGGHRLVARFGRYVLLTPARLARAEGFFGRHGARIVTVARFVEGLRQANGLIAGLTGMPWRRFLGFNALGAALWVGAWAGLGDLAGQNLGTIYPAVRRSERYLLAAAALAVVLLAARRLSRRRAPARAAAGPGGTDGGRGADDGCAGWCGCCTDDTDCADCADCAGHGADGCVGCCADAGEPADTFGCCPGCCADEADGTEEHWCAGCRADCCGGNAG